MNRPTLQQARTTGGRVLRGLTAGALGLVLSAGLALAQEDPEDPGPPDAPPPRLDPGPPPPPVPLPDPGDAPPPPPDSQPGTTPKDLENPHLVAARRRLEALFQSAGAGAVTLGFMVDAVEIGLVEGLQAWNKKDPKTCGDCYQLVISRLRTRMESPNGASASARRLARELTVGLERAAAMSNPGRRAWRLRFVLDRIVTDYDGRAQYLTRLMALGASYFRNGFNEESIRAYDAAIRLQPELTRSRLAAMKSDLRLAHLSRSRPELAEGQWERAAKSLSKAMTLVPEWPTHRMNPASSFPSADAYRAMLQRLLNAWKADSANPHLLFLLGHEYYFLGRLEEAGKIFRKLLAVKPGHRSATLFLQALPGSELQNTLDNLVDRLGSVDARERDAAVSKLLERGRWSLPALRRGLMSPNGTVQNLCGQLIRRIEPPQRQAQPRSGRGRQPGAR